MGGEREVGGKTDLVACKYLVMNDKYKNLNVIFLPLSISRGRKMFNKRKSVAAHFKNCSIKMAFDFSQLNRRIFMVFFSLFLYRIVAITDEN